MGHEEKIKIWPTETINRTHIKDAPYNPRFITDKNRKKLRANLVKSGLMGGIIWNKRTGNLVSGHQRLSIIDSAYKTQDYDLPVTVVDISIEDEKKQNIALNNKEMQGDFDMEKLRELMTGMDGIEDTGFTETDTLQMFGDGLNYSTEEYKAAVEQAYQAAETFRKIRKLTETANDNFYCVIVWKEHSQRQLLLDKLKLEDNKFLAASDFISAIKEAVLRGDL